MSAPPGTFDELGRLRFRVPEGVLHQRLDEETVLLDLDSGVYYGLDEVGTRVWELLSAHGSLPEVRRTMLDEYEVNEARLTADLVDLTRELLAAGLLAIDGAATRA